MKHRISRVARTLSCGALVFIACFGAPQIVGARTVAAGEPTTIEAFASLQIDHRVLDASGQFVLTLKNSPFESARFYVGVFRAGTTQKLAETRREFTRQNGELRANFQLSAPPGDYEIRLLSDDKKRAPLLISAVVSVVGMRREAGWWLFNGQAFVSGDDANADATVATSNASLFIQGLKRDFGKKPKTSRTFNAGETLQYRVLELPSLDKLSDPKYDFAALKTKIVAQLDDARKNGARNLAGFALPLGVPNRNIIASDAKVVIGRVRAILNEVAPEAALILDADTFFAMFRIHTLEDCAPLCDAAIVQTNGDSITNLWAVKNLRRVAEEQPAFDLPILVRNLQDAKTGRAYNTLSDSHATELLMSGATGFIEYSNDAPNGWKNVVNRNLPLFIGSVTLEDIGVLNSSEWFPGIVPSFQNDPLLAGHSIYLFERMRDAGRIPLAARLPDLTQSEKNRKSESLMVSFETRISRDTIEQLRAAANAGHRVYIEGAPTQDENGVETGWRLGSLVGADLEKNAGDTTKMDNAQIDAYFKAQDDTMNLQDGWMFGTLRGTKLRVSSPFKVKLNALGAPPKAKEQKGLDVLTAPRVAAVLQDGSPALVVNPVGKGEVVWQPFRVLETSATRRTFDQAVSNYIEPSLVELRATDKTTEIGALHVALRRSPQGALLLGIFNDGDKAASVETTIVGAADVALDLRDEIELLFSTRGNETTFSATLPAHGAKLIAFAVSRKALDDERDDFSGKVRLK